MVTECDLYQETITVLNSVGERVDLLIQVFVDEGFVGTDLEQSSSGMEVIEFKDVYITPVLPKPGEETRGGTDVPLVCAGSGALSFSLSNYTRRDLMLVPKSDLVTNKESVHRLRLISFSPIRIY